MRISDIPKDKLAEMMKNPKSMEKLAVWYLNEQKEDSFKDYFQYSKNYIKITDKKGRTVPLVQNNVQIQIQNKITELQSKGIPPRIIVLKSRQMGVSTDIQGRMVYETATKENKNGYIVSHLDESTSAIFSKAKYTVDNLPEIVKPLQKASNAIEIVFDTPLHYKGKQKGLHSKIEIKTSGSAGIGRSETRHYIHLSEFGFWKGSDNNSPEKQLSAIMQAVPDDVDTWVIIESTANGLNAFYELWQQACKGENAFVPMFFPWYMDSTYKCELTELEEKAWRIYNDSINKDKGD